MTNISDHIIIPKWLDDFLVRDLSAYFIRKNTDLVVLEWNEEDILGYLGTYFPRSYAESYRIFTLFFSKYKSRYESNKTISIFDFGCGTGGELVGFIVAASELLPNLECIELRALDGNAHELRYLELILNKVSSITGIKCCVRLMPIVIEDFYDMKVVTDVITQKYDFFISFKAICEFVTKKQFDERNPYEHIINTFLPKLSKEGIICIADITTFNKVSNEWLTNMLDKASTSCDVIVLEKNHGYNEVCYVTHSLRKRDLSKIAWRIYKPKNNKS
jgi:hypothetical protein